MTQSAVRYVVLSYFRSFAGRDPSAIAAHVSEDFANEHASALGSGCVGRADYEARLPGFLNDMAGLEYHVEDLLVEGDRAVVTYTMTARWQSRTPIKIRGAQRLVVRDGLIVHRTDYWDSADFLRQADQAAADVLSQFGISGG